MSTVGEPRFQKNPERPPYSAPVTADWMPATVNSDESGWPVLSRSPSPGPAKAGHIVSESVVSTDPLV
jgi:hypothetical protein